MSAIDGGSVMSVAAIYRFRAALGNADELLTMLQKGRDFSRTMRGCESFDIYQGVGDRHQFTMVERWATAEAHLEHFEQNVKGSGVLDAAEALMAEPFPPPQESHYLLR